MMFSSNNIHKAKGNTLVVLAEKFADVVDNGETVDVLKDYESHEGQERHHAHLGHLFFHGIAQGRAFELFDKEEK